MTSNSFPFIVSNGPKLQNDPSIRAVIRKQAMKDVGNARRKRIKADRVDVTRLSLEATDVPIRSAASSDSPRESSSTESSDSSRSTDETDYDELLPRRSEAAGSLLVCCYQFIFKLRDCTVEVSSRCYRPDYADVLPHRPKHHVTSCSRSFLLRLSIRLSAVV